MTEDRQETTITKIDTIDGMYSIVSGYRNRHFNAAVYDGPRLIKSKISKNEDARTIYEDFRASVIEGLKANEER